MISDPRSSPTGAKPNYFFCWLRTCDSSRESRAAFAPAYITHTHTHPFNGPLSGTTRVGRYQNGKIDLDLLKQETVSGSGISWAIYKPAPRSRQITMPAPHHSVFTGRMPFLPPNQQRQSTEGSAYIIHSYFPG